MTVLDFTNKLKFLGRATLQNWSLILYGSKEFLSLSSITNEPVKPNKNKPNRGFKKKSKQKLLQKLKNQRQPIFSTKPPKVLSKSKPKLASAKEKDPLPTLVQNSTFPTGKNKQLSTEASTTTSDFSPYFYAVSNSKLKLSHENMVKHYLKFVKNVTITYPVMIPARESQDKKNFKKGQKLKEKSRDINFNSQNLKIFLPKSTEKPSGKDTKGNFRRVASFIFASPLF